MSELRELSMETLEKRILESDPESDGCSVLVNEWVRLTIQEKREKKED